MPVRRLSVRRLLLLVALALPLALSAAPAGAAHAGAKLQLRKTRVGTILVDARGYTLYAFTLDRSNRNACLKRPGCKTVWPAFTSATRPSLGPGVKAQLVGSIKLPGGARQVTYGGHPLYRFVPDTGPGQTFGINILQFGGRWPAVNAVGGEIK
jgi:predicted lipoprotein with Yx(FWY)xxD motif